MYSKIDNENFSYLIDSLKKSRRADLSDISGDPDAIRRLYVDPLEGNIILDNVLKPNNTLLVGRKGTGKSTIISRLEYEIAKNESKLFSYIDVKSVSDEVKQTGIYDLKKKIKNPDSYDSNLIESYLFHKKFTDIFFIKLFNSIEKSLAHKLLHKKSKFDSIKLKLNKERQHSINESVIDIDILKSFQQTIINQNTKFESSNSNITISHTPSIKLSKARGGSSKKQLKDEITLKILKNYPFMNIMNSIQRILMEEGFKSFYIALDDLSELDNDTYRIFNNLIIVPLNNSNYEFYKLKICVYPYRFFLEEIDPTKIDILYLDYIKLYAEDKITDTEKGAINFVKRLLNNRSKYFLNKNFGDFLDLEKHDENTYYTKFFHISSAIPRNLGWILWHAFVRSLAKGQKIKISDLEKASENFYLSGIELFLKHISKMSLSYEDKTDLYFQKNLLDLIIGKTRENKSEISKLKSKIFSDYGKKPPTSHFYIRKELEKHLYSLELNQFISKYSEQKDQDAVENIFYYLNFGLCMNRDIIFGKGKDRKYIIQRRFNYSNYIKDFINKSKEIICDSCRSVFPMDDLEKLSYYDMLCPNCKSGKCKLEDKNLGAYISVSNKETLFKELELRFLQSLILQDGQTPNELAQELDVSYQKVGYIAKGLKEKENLVEKKREKRKLKYYLNSDNLNKIEFLMQ